VRCEGSSDLGACCIDGEHKDLYEAMNEYLSLRGNFSHKTNDHENYGVGTCRSVNERSSLVG
jgi:hypothetical protein